MTMNTFSDYKSIKTDEAYGLLGVGDSCVKLVEDFRFVFGDRLSIGGVIEWRGDSKDFRADSGCGYDCYICCTYDRNDAVKKLDRIGLVYKKDYYFAEDFFPLLDDWKGHRIAYKSYPGTVKGWLKSIIFGYSARHGKVLPEDVHRNVLKGNYEAAERRQKRNLAVYALYFLLGSLEALPQIFSKGNGYTDYEHISFYSASEALKYKSDFPSAADRVITVEELKTHTMASLYMRAVYYDRRQNRCACDIPLTTVWVGIGGSSRLCDCPAFLDVGCGNIGIANGSDVWKSGLAKIVRLSVINNTYTFCSRAFCSKLVRDENQVSLLERKKIEETESPLNICIANDSVCNLHCPSCRKKIYSKNDENTEAEISSCISSIDESGWLEKAEKICVGGSGESFLSNNYKRVIYEAEAKRKNIVIMTNGTLFTQQEWEKLEGKYEHISFLVSVDAATGQTYEKVRCGGNFERLMNNMDFLSKLRREKKVDSVKVIMVVQKANYLEIPDFIRWAQEKGFDGVSLSNIRNWGTYSDEVFYNDYSMFDRNGNMKPELAAVLGDPVCKDPIVDMRWAGSRNLS